jgi:beta-mannosidase
MAVKRTFVELKTGWSFKQTDDANEDAWLLVKSVPSTVHQDLIDNKKYES